MTVAAHLATIALLAATALAGCSKKGGGSEALSKYPGTDDGAKQLVTDIRTGDGKAMTAALQPSKADYEAVFDGAVAGDVQSKYKELWDGPGAHITADAANTELIISHMTTDDLKAWTPQAEADFPGGYKRAAASMKPGLTVYRWKYVKPGEKLGMAYDGLIYVNNHWAWFPKPWRVLDKK